jgi:hypothetical protein
MDVYPVPNVYSVYFPFFDLGKGDTVLVSEDFGYVSFIVDLFFI